jgi:hypothetical protein
MPTGRRSIAFADLDNDGDFDIVAGNLGATSRFYLNENDSPRRHRRSRAATSTRPASATSPAAACSCRELQFVRFDAVVQRRVAARRRPRRWTRSTTAYRADLIADIQQAVDERARDQGLGSAGDIVVGIDAPASLRARAERRLRPLRDRPDRLRRHRLHDRHRRWRDFNGDGFADSSPATSASISPRSVQTRSSDLADFARGRRRRRRRAGRGGWCRSSI